MSGQVQWCSECGRAVGIGCNCGQSFADRIRNIQVDNFSLLDIDRKKTEPKNRGLQRKLK